MRVAIPIPVSLYRAMGAEITVAMSSLPYGATHRPTVLLRVEGTGQRSDLNLSAWEARAVSDALIAVVQGVERTEAAALAGAQVRP